MPKRTVFILIALAFLPGGATAQMTPGIAVQAYPAGLIVQLRGSFETSNRSDIQLSVGVNRAIRGNYGKNDHEEGWGYGLGIGAVRFIRSVHSGFFAGVHLDMWLLSIDWKDRATNCSFASCSPEDNYFTGTTRTATVQPTGKLGFRGRVSPSITFDASVALGVEINAHTDGRAVGEGLIGLLGIAVAF